MSCNRPVWRRAYGIDLVVAAAGNRRAGTDDDGVGVR